MHIFNTTKDSKYETFRLFYPQYPKGRNSGWLLAKIGSNYHLAVSVEVKML